MDFDLSEEQVMFKDTIDRLVAKEYGFEQRRKYQSEATGYSRGFWEMLAEQGFLALPFDEADGGLGYGPVEMMLVCEALGRGLTLEPYLSTVVVAGAALRVAASDVLRSEWIPAIASGERVLVLASTERQSRYNFFDVATTARRDGDEYVINGTKIAIQHGADADALIVSARSSGDRDDHSGISLYIVDAKTPGVRLRRYRTQDGTIACDAILDDVRVSAAALLGAEGEGGETLARAADFAIAAIAAEAAGCMQATLDMTVDYLQQRRQFGAPIGIFQALQHQAADMLIELEQTRSMAIYAALMVGQADPQARRQAMSMVKVQVSRSARIVGQLAVQLHGGIGVSEEYAVGHYFRRLTMMEAQFGDADFHLAVLGSLS